MDNNCTKCNGKTTVMEFIEEEGITAVPCMDCVDKWNTTELDAVIDKDINN